MCLCSSTPPYDIPIIKAELLIRVPLSGVLQKILISNNLLFQEPKIPAQLPMDEEPCRVYGYTVVCVSKTLPWSYKQRTLDRKKTSTEQPN